MMYGYKKGFTLVELIIVISILIILTTISIVSYDNTLVDARNSARMTDMSNIKISLKNHKLKNGSYPKPGHSFTIKNQSQDIIVEGTLDDDVVTQEIINKPRDPQVKNFYMYSITSNKAKFQVAMSLEDESVTNASLLRAYVDGDYQRVADFIPSIVLATSTGGDISTLSGMFIVNKGSLNLPYDTQAKPVKTATGFTAVIGETGVAIPNFYGYYSCTEIGENGSYMGTGVYKTLNSTGDIISTTCTGSSIP